MKKTIKRYEIEEFWYEIASQKYEKLKVWKYTQMMSMVWKNTKGMKKIPKVWNRNSRYEKDTQKDAQGMIKNQKVIKCVFRYEIGFSLKNGFFIPLWVDFIPFWVWKKSLFFPDAYESFYDPDIEREIALVCPHPPPAPEPTTSSTLPELTTSSTTPELTTSSTPTELGMCN